MQTKTKRKTKYDHMNIKIAMMETDNANCWWGYEATQVLIHGVWDAEWYTPSLEGPFEISYKTKHPLII